MNQTRLTIILSGLAIVVVAAAAGYGLGMLAEKRVAPEAPRTPEATALPSPSPSLPLPSLTPTASPLPASPRVPAAAPTGPDQGPPEPVFRVVIEPFPTVVRAGTPLRVRWQIHGPAGLQGAATRLVVVPEQGSPVVSAVAPSALFPARFEATVTAPDRGRMLLVAEATANGQTVHAKQRVVVE
ncbi:MAG: hypothetical protein G01um101438_159 [Parcubacteria group bacterium Gr01-1014_38]|nr:MAG: hypothetical protein G01um101438_159 [Parcubacteria group bacterium Gr01-1014_38]